MFRFGLTNMRRLRSVEPIPIRPITLLLGRNSGGKSTYLRSFPLIRQSLMTRTSSPILWYGDLVDFGSFDTSISRQDPTGSLSFSLSADEITVGGGTIFAMDDGDVWSGFSSSRVTYSDVLLRVTISRSGERVRLSSMEVELPSIATRIQLSIDDSQNVNKISVNGDDIVTELDSFRFTTMGNSLLPELRLNRDRGTSRTGVTLPAGAPLFKDIRSVVRSIIDKRIGDSTVSQMTSELMGHGAPSDQYLIDLGAQTGMTALRNFTALVNDGGPLLKRLYALLFASWLPSLTRSLSQYFRSVLTSTLYIGPARARSERYYRYQDLSVSEIDPDGKNFPMFLNSLSARQLDDFSSWVEGLFGYGVRVSRQTGHISINLINGSVATNIVDVGYGVSQILPVLGQIWWATSRPQSRDERAPVSLLAIEQPELHLHPAHQALLADALLSGTSTAQRRPINFLVETHSETLVNRFGEFIAHQRISPDDVQIMLFDTMEDSTTKVRTVKYDADGTLLDWPYGFFQAPAL